MGEADLNLSIDTDSYQSINSDDNSLDYEWIDISNNSNQIVMSHNDYAANEAVNMNIDFPF